MVGAEKNHEILGAGFKDFFSNSKIGEDSYFD